MREASKFLYDVNSKDTFEEIIIQFRCFEAKLFKHNTKLIVKRISTRNRIITVEVEYVKENKSSTSEISSSL